MAERRISSRLVEARVDQWPVEQKADPADELRNAHSELLTWAAETSRIQGMLARGDCMLAHAKAGAARREMTAALDFIQAKLTLMGEKL